MVAEIENYIRNHNYAAAANFIKRGTLISVDEDEEQENTYLSFDILLVTNSQSANQNFRVRMTNGMLKKQKTTYSRMILCR